MLSSSQLKCDPCNLLLVGTVNDFVHGADDRAR